MLRLTILALSISAVLATGCYTLEPVRGTPVEGTPVAFDLNDRGRVAMGGALGPEIAQVEGRIVQHDSDAYLLGVTSVSYLRGGNQTWKGEPVLLKSDYISNMYERRFNKPRTAIAVAAGVAATALIVTQGLIGAGNVNADEKPPSDTGLTRRSPIPHRIPILSIGISRIPFFGRP